MFNRSNDPAFPAKVSTFALDTFEVTVGRFRAFVAAYGQTMISGGAGGNPNNSNDRGWDVTWNANLPADRTALTAGLQCNGSLGTWRDPPWDDSLPVNCITWYEAHAFCIWDGGRLPTEAEWNYAAAGGNEQRVYPWGDAGPGTNASLAVYGCFWNSAETCTGITNMAPVGSVPAGNARWGQANMAGNVWEWVQDGFHVPYASTACSDCVESMTDTPNRVVRGGSFAGIAAYLFTSDRGSTTPTSHDSNVGIRCARAL
jgi:formylglycine-generating enzyme required for sulfatase activity